MAVGWTVDARLERRSEAATSMEMTDGRRDNVDKLLDEYGGGGNEHGDE